MKIKINKLQLFGYHGVYDEEKNNGQDFEISASLKIDRPKIKDDRLEATIDYTQIIDKIVSVFNSKRYSLLESLLNDIFLSILSDKHILSADISIKKINPPIKLKLESIEIKDKRKNA
tara:strand:- start:158 stop:511 length:354 start_codon:yes stop_codon:yes gene_type:complete